MPIRSRRGAIQVEAWERALYEAHRAQHERSMLLRKMAQAQGERKGASLLRQRAESYEEGAELRRLIAHHNASGRPVADSET